MYIVSINAAQPATIHFNGETVETGIFKKPQQGNVKITQFGVQGDAIVDKNVHGGLDQAVYLYQEEDYHWWSNELGKPLSPGLFGENITVAGLADVSLVIGDRLLINDVELEITAPRTPCYKLATRMEDSAFAKKFVRAQRPGAYARVLREGHISAGDTITLQQTKGDFASIAEVFELWHNKERSEAVIKKALASPVGIIHRTKLQAWLNQLELA